MKTTNYWTPEKIDYLINHFAENKEQLSIYLNLSIYHIKQKIKDLGLVHPKEILKNNKKQKCTKCLIIKDFKEFGQNNRSKNKLTYSCKSCNVKASKQYKISHPNEIKAYRKNYNKLNKEKNYQRHKNRYYSDPSYNLAHKLRRRIRNAVWRASKGARKFSTTIKVLGCSFKELEQYFIPKFTPQMKWELFLKGEIVIDHIKPIASFDLSKKEEFEKCFHYSNTQPLWKTTAIARKYGDLISKGNAEKKDKWNSSI